MNWSARPHPLRTLLLVVLALFAGALAGTFLIDGGSAEPQPPSETAGGTVSTERDDAGTLPTPLTFATATRSAPAIEDTAPPGTAATGRSVAVGAAAPDFTLPDLFDHDTTYTLSAYQGQPIILNFWASWCVPCRREMPALQQTAADYQAEGLVLLGMNQTYLDTLGEARAFVRELALTFPTTRDDDGATGASAYQIVGIPTTVFITRDGAVAHIQVGEMSLEQITAYTEQLIAGQPIQP